MVTGHRKVQMPQIPIDMDALGFPPLTEEDMKITAEEMSLSTLYSDRMAWVRMLSWQIRSGTSRLHGPPGLLDKMVLRLRASTARNAQAQTST